MLKTLPMYYSFSNLPNFLPIVLFIPIAPPIISFLFYCVSDNITMQEWLYIIYNIIADYIY